jgi:hypothetical protein
MTQAIDIILEDQIRECFGRVVYSHKTHECMADQAMKKLGRYRIIQIVLTGLTSVGAIGVVVSNDTVAQIPTALLAFLTFFVSTYLKDFDLGLTAQKHRDCAAKLWAIRESYCSLLTDINVLKRDDITAKRDELQSLLATVYESAPRTNAKAYSEAQDRLKNKEDLTFSSEEIDYFLPDTLKRAGRDFTLKSKNVSD